MGRSTLLKRIRQGADEKTIRYEWQRWNKANGVVQNGLIRRRKEEVDLYFKK
jgi:GH24 family phage-related lysozyme (muramidase)